MPADTVNITGTFSLPDATWPAFTRAEFVISGYDTDVVVVAPMSVLSTLSAGGVLDVDLWANQDGLRGTTYRVYVNFYTDDSYSNITRTLDFGDVQIITDADITSLLDTPVSVPGVWYSAITEAQYDEVIAAVDEVNAAVDAALLAIDGAEDAAIAAQVAAEAAQALAEDAAQSGGIVLASANGVLPANSAATNTTNLQSLINSLTSKTILFDEGTYELNSITLKPTVGLKGAGRGKTVIAAGSNSITIFDYLVSGSIKQYFAIDEMSFSANGKTSVTAIKIDGASSILRASDIYFSKLSFVGDFTTNIHLIYCANTEVLNCRSFGTTTAFLFDKCADTSVESCYAQNFPATTSGVGFSIIGGAGATDEGMRLMGCVTNGPGIGLAITGQDWGMAVGCSFTTAHAAPLIFSGTVNNWKFTGCEFAAAASVTGVTMTSGCSSIIFDGCHFILNSFGIILLGTSHVVTGCIFHNNSNVDIYLNPATRCVITGNQLQSSGVAQSVLGVAGSDYTLVANNVGNGTFGVTGTGSSVTGNVTY